MNYTIKNEKTYLNRVYHTNDKIVYKINNTKVPDFGGIEDKPIIYDNSKDNNELFVTIIYDDGTTQYVSLESYIDLGTTIDGENTKTIEGKKLHEIFKAQQEEEMVNQILNGADPYEVYKNLPAFFKGVGGIDFINCDNYRTVTRVSPDVTIKKPCNDDGTLTDEFIEKYIIPKAKQVAQKAVDDYVCGLDPSTGVKLYADVSKTPYNA